MSEQEKHDFKWWLKTGAQVLVTTAISFAPEILQVFPEHTVAFKLALPIGFAVKLFLTKSEYKKDKLPNGMAKILDKVDDKYTGVRGSENVRGTQEEEL